MALNLMVLTPMSKSTAALEQAPSEIPVSVSAEEQANIAVYERNAPAVVGINSGKNQGAGVILTSDGLVVTNKHVVLDAKTVTVKLADDRFQQARVVALGLDNKDLAFLRLNGRGPYPTAKMGDSGLVRVGQRVLAIGSPFGLDGTLTTGIVSRIDRTRNMIQTDAAINPGNSGGPLLNIRGELIGINRSIINPVGASSAGVSFAVPINVVKQQIASIGPSSTLAQR
jgi:serine protease Do